MGGLRSCGSGVQEDCLDSSGGDWHGAAVFGRGAPSVFPLPLSKSQGGLGCVSTPINFSSVSEMTFGGISMLSLGGVGPPLC